MSNIFKLLAVLIISIQSVNAAVSYEEYLSIKKALYLAYEELKPNNNEVLSINTPIPGLDENYWWDIDMVHASYVRVEAEDSLKVTHNIYLMGGFARLEGMTPDGLALTACHEIGHGIGGPPKKKPSAYDDVASTSEGQSDYFAAKTCLPVVLKYLEQTREVMENEFVSNLCEKQNHYDQMSCMRYFTALESDIYFFSTYAGEVSFEEYSTEVALELNDAVDFYPSAQCRLDTMIHGILKLERPECWYPGGAANGTLRQ